MKIGIAGGGINGICSAWQLALVGHQVTVFERGKLLSETSSASSKLLHGGFRYLENLEFRLVKEALQERAWWLEHAPQYTSKLKFCFPLYAHGRRAAWKIKLGLMLYDCLAGDSNIHGHLSMSAEQARGSFTLLKREGLKKVFVFYDGQMDDKKLGGWVVEQAQEAGVLFVEDCEVTCLNTDGSLSLNGCHEKFDRIINMTGPWASELNRNGGITSAYDLDLVRGSHIVLDRQIDCGYLFEVPDERRIFFVLPYDGKALVGTTEVRQRLGEPIKCSNVEKAYLLSAYNNYFIAQADASDIIEDFSGLRPLIKSAEDPGRATREYVIEKRGRLITVFGGKWTTARALAKNIVKEVDDGFH